MLNNKLLNSVSKKAVKKMMKSSKFQKKHGISDKDTNKMVDDFFNNNDIDLKNVAEKFKGHENELLNAYKSGDLSNLMKLDVVKDLQKSFVK